MGCEFVFEYKEYDDEDSADEAKDNGNIGNYHGCVILVVLVLGSTVASSCYSYGVGFGNDGFIGGDGEGDVVGAGMLIGVFGGRFGAGVAITELPLVGDVIGWSSEVYLGGEGKGL